MIKTARSAFKSISIIRTRASDRMFIMGITMKMDSVFPGLSVR